jgi:hypothetical protein
VPALQAGLVWFGPHVASTTVFAPYAATGVNGINPMLSVGDPHTLARNSGMVGCIEVISSVETVIRFHSHTKRINVWRKH